MAELESLTGLTLDGPWFLLLALLVPVGLFLRHRFGAPAVLFAPQAVEPGLPHSWRVRLLFLPPGLTVLGLLLTVVALARPVERVPIPRTTEGIDILLCLDVSSSMAANDMDPRRDRLSVAKDAAARFIAGRPDDRIGLIRFARFPDLVSPLTLDHGALLQILEDVSLVENDGPEDATGIGAAVARAAQVLGDSEASRVVILLTDGEENVATAEKPEEIAPLHAGQLCEKLLVRVYGIAAGLGGRDSEGNWVALDTLQVRRLVERSGGKFYEARDAGAVAGVFAEIDELTRAEFTEPYFRVEERFLPFLAAAVALLLLSRLLEVRVLAVLP